MESAQLPTEDTTELEEDVTNAEESVTELRAKKAELERLVNQNNPALESAKRQHEEVTARNEKVLAEINSSEKALLENSEAIRSEQHMAKKKGDKICQLQDGLQKTLRMLSEEREKMLDALSKAKLLTLKAKIERDKKNEEANEEDSSVNFTQEELDAVEPVRVTKEPQFYQAKIERAIKQIERERSKRQISEADGAVLYEKLKRAKADLHTKLSQIDSIDENVNKLVADLKARKDRWMHFRKHIAEMTSNTFDDMLNKKGSSGEIVFDHENKTLNLVVQKDNANANTQTNDVKALSGGERSFTTLSLLLALGENLETPFRVSNHFSFSCLAFRLLTLIYLF
jgi:chromosome segregation ATPase